MHGYALTRTRTRTHTHTHTHTQHTNNKSSQQEFMVLRHHNEAESLHAVQRMDWEWKLKELGDCDANSRPHIDDLHVPMVHVSDDFDLLPE